MPVVKFLTLKKSSNVRLRRKRSLFIALAHPVRSPEEARSLVAEAQRSYPDADHHPYAYRFGEEEFSSDAGEPSGTAGRPVLGAIKKKGLNQVVVIVVRYFGGKKLGVRGLIDAYRESAELALERAGSVLVSPRIYFSVVTDGPSFNLAVNRLKTLAGKEGSVELEPKRFKVLLALPAHKRQDALEALETERETGSILKYEEYTSPGKTFR